VAQVQHKALSSNPSTAKKKKQKQSHERVHSELIGRIKLFIPNGSHLEMSLTALLFICLMALAPSSQTGSSLK
jgi:hypothetical protein